MLFVLCGFCTRKKHNKMKVLCSVYVVLRIKPCGLRERERNLSKHQIVLFVKDERKLTLQKGKDIAMSFGLKGM